MCHADNGPGPHRKKQKKGKAADKDMGLDGIAAEQAAAELAAAGGAGSSDAAQAREFAAQEAVLHLLEVLMQVSLP